MGVFRYWLRPAVVLFLLVASSLMSSVVVTEELSLPQEDTSNPNRAQEIAAVAAQIQNLPREWPVGNLTCILNRGMVPVPGTLAERLIREDQAGLRATESVEDPPRIAALAAKYVPTFDSLDSFAPFYEELANQSEVLDVPFSLNRIDDASFASMRLTIFATRLERVRGSTTGSGTSLPNIRASVVRDVCGSNAGGLNRLKRDRRLYVEDLSFAWRYNDPSKSTYAPGVITYYCVTDDNKEFMPLAIEVLGGDHPNGPPETLLYTKFDSEEDWTLAKMGANTASIMVQTMDHFYETHVFLDPIRVTLMRTVHPTHPIYNLLQHHFTINTGLVWAGLEGLIRIDSFFDRIYGWGAAGSCLAMQDNVLGGEVKFRSLQDDLRRRGLTSSKVSEFNLPDFKYRTDILRVVRAVRTFVRGHLRAYYENSADIRRDNELQAWAAETSEVVPGFPSRVKSVKHLISILTDIIYVFAVQHNGINSDVVWAITSHPYYQPSLNHPWPSRKGESINLMDYVVPPESFATMHFLTSFFVRFIPLSVSLAKSYTETNVSLGTRSDEAIAKFESTLARIDEQIAAREANQERPYRFLRPTRLPYYSWA